jgi:predicted PurR-regulated permease PerM
MNTPNSNVPLYIRLAQIIMGLLAFFFILYIGRSVLVPVIFATILAILLNPLVNYLHRKKINRIIAITIALLLAIIVVASLVYFIVSQMAMFSSSMPQLQEGFKRMGNDVLGWVASTFNISNEKIGIWVQTMKGGTMNNSGVIIGQTVSGISNLFAFIFLLPVYIFMILFYKPLLLEFIARLFDKQKHNMVAEVLLESKTLIQSYLLGLLVETLIVAVLNSIGLLLLGVHYALLIGILGAILNIIPYIGGLVAITLPVIMTLATQNTTAAIYVIIVYTIIQFVDNNLIVPRIVASKVRMNALVSLIVVLTGGALWGIPGMFLSIPLTAIAKVIFDRVEGLKPFGFLIGDNQPEITKVIFNFGRVRLRKTTTTTTTTSVKTDTKAVSNVP